MPDVTNFDPKDLEAAPAEIGDNQPPKQADPLRDRLYAEYKEQIDRKVELADAFADLPDDIEDERTAGEFADFIKQVNGFMKKAKAIHDDEKEPYLKAGKTVDNFWHYLIDDLKDLKAKADVVRKRYADRKANAERLRREEEQRKAQEEAERARAEAEAKQRELEEQLAEARRKAEQAEREAAEERKRHEQEMEKQRQMMLRGVETEEELNAAIAQEEAERKAREREEAEERRRILAEREEANRLERERLKEVKRAEQEADRAERAAARAARKADAPPAELGRSRGEYGGMTTLRRTWLIADLNRAEIDLEALRSHFDSDDIEKAIRRWIDANKEALQREQVSLRGVRIYQDTTL